MCVIVIVVSRPEETPEAILGTSWHDMSVQVRNALAHDVVHGDERPGRVGHRGHNPRHTLHPREERADLGDREVGQSDVVLAWHHQRVTDEQWPDVEKRDGDLVGHDDRSG